MLVVVVVILVEGTFDPITDEDPIPKLNVVPDPLRDDDCGPTKMMEFEGMEGPLVDVMG